MNNKTNNNNNNNNNDNDNDKDNDNDNGRQSTKKIIKWKKECYAMNTFFIIRAISCNSISIITILLTITIVPTHLS